MATSDEKDEAMDRLADTNMENYGSPEHRALRKKAAEGETAWQELKQLVDGDNNVVQVWRIEKFRVKAWPEAQYGQFHSGDSYIILNTYLNADGTEKRYNLHFWLGGETTQDEAGTAAYKTVELDDFLGDLPVQFREVEGIETKEFLNLFPGGIKYLEGGVATGFRHVEDVVYPLRMYRVFKEGRKKRVIPCPPCASSLNTGDCFVLDAGLEIFSWYGPKCSPFEKTPACKLANKIESARCGRAREVVIDTEGNADHDRFWEILGGKPDEIAAEHVALRDREDFAITMTKVDGDSGKIDFGEPTAPLAYGNLDQGDVYFIDAGESAYIWIGSGASDFEKEEAMRYATTRLDESGRAFCTAIRREISGKETAEFLALLPEE